MARTARRDDMMPPLAGGVPAVNTHYSKSRSPCLMVGSRRELLQEPRIVLRDMRGPRRPLHSGEDDPAVLSRTAFCSMMGALPAPRTSFFKRRGSFMVTRRSTLACSLTLALACTLSLRAQPI